MSFKSPLAVLLTAFFTVALHAQLKVTGLVKDKFTGQGLSRVMISLQGNDSLNTSTDSNGYFVLVVTKPGFISLKASLEKYGEVFTEEVLVTFDKSPYVVIEMESKGYELKSAVIVKDGLQQRKSETPVSTQQLSIREIERNPGGNRDISKIVTSLPGVISIPGFRNDIIIRGGAPSENKFYLDGIEIPVINHFQTQGATGGPVGILNVNFIKEATVYTAGFPVNLSNGLSAILDFRQIEGNAQKTKYRFTVGSSDFGLTADGSLGKKKKTGFIISARQSYLQGLFSVLGLPFLPNFIDYQAKFTIPLSPKDQLSIIGVGAVDFFRLNEKVNEGVTDSAKIKENRYILGNIPDFSQWNYTIGAVYRHFSGTSTQTIFVSRNYLNNRTKKYFNNDESDPDNKILDYSSTEGENKLRFEHSTRKGLMKILAGFGTEWATYTNSTFNKFVQSGVVRTIDFSSTLNILKYNLFLQISGPSKWKGLNYSLGLRADGNNYNSTMQNPLNQLTGTAGFSYSFSKRWFLNGSLGQFQQLPAYTILGYRNANGDLENKDQLKYISGQQVVIGMQWNPGNTTKITIEGFHKWYGNYPFSLRDSISLGNLGSDFSVVGNEPIASNSKGKAYGMEFLLQKRSRSGVYGILSYTLSWSQFSNKMAQLIASAWDSRHTLSLTGGYKIGKNWEIGAKYRLVTGRPFTPFNIPASLQRSNWDVRGVGIPDYSRLNAERLTTFTQFDLRIDKVWYLKKFSLNLYLDIQNALNNTYKGPDNLTVVRDAAGNAVVDPSNPQNYLADYIPNTTGTLLPTIGIIFDF